MTRSRAFIFTLNNYNSDNIKSLSQMEAQYILYGKETAPTTGTQHLQGYIYYKLQTTTEAVIKRFNKLNMKPHIEIARGTIDQNYDYCTKGGDYTEQGTKPKNREAQSKQLAQNVMLDYPALFESGLSLKDVIKQNVGLYARYGKNIETMYNMFKPKQGTSLQQLRPWQNELTDILEKDTSDRTIHWVYDPIGNNGKSKLASHLVMQSEYIRLTNGKTADIAHSWNGENVVFDYSRSQEELINYGILEDVKNGSVFSPKYDSKCKSFKSPKVCCMSNFLPDVGKMSQDRWQIYTIENNKLLNITETIVKRNQPAVIIKQQTIINTEEEESDDESDDDDDQQTIANKYWSYKDLYPDRVSPLDADNIPDPT